MSGGTKIEAAEALLGALRGGDEAAAAGRMLELAQAFDIGLYQEVGKLTRQVHDAVRELTDESALAEITASRLPDTKQRLEFVMEKTAEATHRTLGSVERLLPLADELRTGAQGLAGRWTEARARAEGDDGFGAFSEALSSHIEGVERHARFLADGLADVLTAQEFQDVTGQVIRRTLELISEVEQKLLELVVAMPNGTGSRAAPEAPVAVCAEGPALRVRDDVLASQKDVDELLTSLGF